MRTLIGILIFISINGLCQNSALEVTFTAVDSTTYVQLDSIKIMNRTKGCDTILYWPDTVLALVDASGLDEVYNDKSNFQVFQNFPNPVVNHSTISIYIPEKDVVNITIADVIGRVLINDYKVLGKGYHSFRFIPGDANIYFFTAHWRGTQDNIKILQFNSASYSTCSLEYSGSEMTKSKHKIEKVIEHFAFTTGDKLLCIGFADILQSGINKIPGTIELYTFQFATNIPCIGEEMINYEGQVYNTIQIFNQCWLKENLNVGTRISLSTIMSDNNLLEKYCFAGHISNCTEYGGLYLWWEAMQYDSNEGNRGICPPGWHIPSDEEWKLLEGSVDGFYDIGNSVWDTWGYRGKYAGVKLKANNGWEMGGNGSDSFGFSALPGGNMFGSGNSGGVGLFAFWWSSSELNNSSAWSRNIDFDHSGVYREDFDENVGYSVRCIKD